MTISLRRKPPAPPSATAPPAVASGVLTTEHEAELRAALDRIEAQIAEQRERWAAEALIRQALIMRHGEEEPPPARDAGASTAFAVGIWRGDRWLGTTHTTAMTRAEAEIEAAMWRREKRLEAEVRTYRVVEMRPL